MDMLSGITTLSATRSYFHPIFVVIIGIIALAWLVGAILQRINPQRVSRRFRSWPFLIAAVLWTLYIPWEFYAETQGWNIRVDMLLIGPFLLIVSLAAILLSYRWIFYLAVEGGKVLVGQQPGSNNP